MSDERSEKAETLRTLWGLDHQRLDGLFTELLDRFRDGDREGLRRTWTAFETGLLGHVTAEERYVMPLFARVQPGEASALIQEHAEIRRLLDVLGVGIDLHAVKLDVAQDLVDKLRAHAKREDGLLYAWAERELPAGHGVPDPAGAGQGS